MAPRTRSSRRRGPRDLAGGAEDLTDLAVRAAAGDRAAEAAFVAATVDDVWRYCAHLLGPAEADDATQATYLRALRSLRTFRGESSARTWLLGVARNTCGDVRRSHGRRNRLRDRLEAQPAATGEAVAGTALPVELDQLVAGLDADRREAFVLTQVLGFPYEAAAELLEVPVGTIRSRVARARAELLALVEEAEPPLDRDRRTV